MADQTRRDSYERRKSALKIERESFIPHWKELSQFVQPRRGRFFVDDQNKGGDRYQAIINSKATQAWRAARAGLLAGSCSPSRPWSMFETNDQDLNKFQPVKEWNYAASRVIHTIFAQSNFYNATPTLLGELILFATGAMVDVDDFENVSRFFPLTAGSYMIGQNGDNVVDTLIREWQMTAGQIVDKFGKTGGKVSAPVQNAYDLGNYDSWFPVTHIIQPNDDYRADKKLAKFKRFRSCYYEPGNVDRDAMLRDSGFEDFPVYCPRWDTTGEDVYGTDCPAMTALGDIKGLQIEERRKAQAIDKMVAPPLRGPASLRNVPIDSLPGGATLYDGGDANNKLEPVYSVNPQVQELRIDMQAVEQRIDTAFYVHLFRAISDMQGVQPRNQLELQQRDQERLLELGPLLENLHGEFLARVVERTFAKAARHGILPPAPKELQGRHINAKFISPLAIAQRAVAAGAIERAATFVAGLVAPFPGVAKKFNSNKAVDQYVEAIGAPPTLLVADEVIAAQEEAEQKALAAQQRIAAAGAMADAGGKAAGAVKDLAGAPAGGDTALSRLSEAIQQRAAPNAFQGGGQ